MLKCYNEVYEIYIVGARPGIVGTLDEILILVLSKKGELEIITNVYRPKIFEHIVEDRNGYRVEYRPNNFIKQNFASLNILISRDISKERIASIMEEESEYWLRRFTVPIIATAFDDNEDRISFRELCIESVITGYIEDGEINKQWGCMSEKNFPIRYYDDNILQECYKELKYETISEKSDRIDKELNEKKRVVSIFKLISVIYFVVAVIIAILGFSSPVIGFIACVYSIMMAYKNFMKSRGKISESDRAKQAEKSKMKHYYYHCELNPEGFIKLKADNFRNNRCKNQNKNSI